MNVVATPALRATEKLEASIRLRGSRLCIGLDPDLERIPSHLKGKRDPVRAFLAGIIEATLDVAALYKPNMAYFEALGPSGWDTLVAVLACIPPDIPVLLDAKRGDIGHTARMYARACFDELGADAVTVNPYLGRDTLQPFVDYPDRLTFVLAATSNPGAPEFQDLTDADGLPLHRRVARMVRELDGRPGAVGLVAGATRGEVLSTLREEAPGQWFLVPGVGAQGGDLEAVKALGHRTVVNASRSILYASSGEDFAEAALRAAMETRDALRA